MNIDTGIQRNNDKIKTATKTSEDDVFILHNPTKDVEITSADYLPEIEQSPITCPRCRKINENAQKLLKNLPSINRNDVKGICGHCRTKETCIECEEVVKKFVASIIPAERTENTKERVKQWLSKIKHLLKHAVVDDTETVKEKVRAHSELYIDQLYRISPKTGREPKVQQTFHPETHKSDFVGAFPPSKEKRNKIITQLEKHERPLLFLDSQGKEGKPSTSKAKQGFYVADQENVYVSDTDSEDLKAMFNTPLTEKLRAHSALYIDQLCRNFPKTGREPKVKQMFHPETHKSDVVGAFPPSVEKRNEVITQLEKHERPLLLLDSAGKVSTSKAKEGFDVAVRDNADVSDTDSEDLKAIFNTENPLTEKYKQKKEKHVDIRENIPPVSFQSEDDFKIGMEKSLSKFHQTLTPTRKSRYASDEKSDTELFVKTGIETLKTAIPRRHDTFGAKLQTIPADVAGERKHAEKMASKPDQRTDFDSKKSLISSKDKHGKPVHGLSRKRNSDEALLTDVVGVTEDPLKHDMDYVFLKMLSPDKNNLKRQKNSSELIEEMLTTNAEKEKNRKEEDYLKSEKKRIAREEKKKKADEEKKKKADEERKKKAGEERKNKADEEIENKADEEKKRLEALENKTKEQQNNSATERDKKNKDTTKNEKAKFSTATSKSKMKDSRPELKQKEPNEPKEPKEPKTPKEPKQPIDSIAPKEPRLPKEPKQLPKEPEAPTETKQPNEPKAPKESKEPKDTKELKENKATLKADKDAEKARKEQENKEKEARLKTEKEEKERVMKEKEEQLQREKEIQQIQKSKIAREKSVKKNGKEKPSEQNYQPENETRRKENKEAKEKRAIEESSLLLQRPKDIVPVTKLVSDKSNVGKIVKEPIAKDINIKSISVRAPSNDNLILRLVKIEKDNIKEMKHKLLPGIQLTGKVVKKPNESAYGSLYLGSDMELDAENLVLKNDKDLDIIIGPKIFKYKPSLIKKQDDQNVVPLIFQSTFDDANAPAILKQIATPPRKVEVTAPVLDTGKQGYGKFVSSQTNLTYNSLLKPASLFVPTYYTFCMIPTNCYVGNVTVAHPEFDWFEHNKHKKLMQYDSGEKLAEFEDDGGVHWFYRNGRMALDYYNAEELNAQQRFVIYSSGEPDERGRARPYAVLATFDYLGNGIVYDHNGKVRLKYNQTEGVLLDPSIGPESHWKWHTLNDPPVLQQVMIDTQMAHKDPAIIKLGPRQDSKARPDNEDMLAIEFDNFIKEKSKKMSQSFKPFQIKMKALKINEQFSLRVLDQASVYLIYRDGTTNLKLNIGMVLDHKEIVDTDTAEVSDVSNNMERLPALTDSLAKLQKSVANAQDYATKQKERERRIRPIVPRGSADALTAATSKPLR
ncbi:Uncharacterized protein OBRU01_03663, partial [Operophtera brumata]